MQATQYTYNALGQRVTKKVGSTVTIFQYDLDGNLMAELTASGQPLRQHVHVNGEPVAQLSTNPADGALSVQYVHADHLGTPTLLTNQSGAVVADIEAEPFGERYIDYAEVTHNRRFPGQYRDEETGLHYNYFRDYDPTTGRYNQSDPIGLEGGINTYAYVSGNPMNYLDPFGLVRWSGSSFSVGGTLYDRTAPIGPGGGVLFEIYTLRARCKNGEYASARVHAVGALFAVGIPFALSGSQTISLEDGAAEADPSNLSGQYIKAGGAYGVGLGVGSGYLKLGKAESQSLKPSLFAGVDVGVSVAGGRAIVVAQKKCECEE